MAVAVAVATSNQQEGARGGTCTQCRSASANMHLKHTQSERNAAMQQMRAFELRVLVATDLLARGVANEKLSLAVYLRLMLARDCRMCQLY